MAGPFQSNIPEPVSLHRQSWGLPDPEYNGLSRGDWRALLLGGYGMRARYKPLGMRVMEEHMGAV